MEYLQYITYAKYAACVVVVLNLVINGIPSIRLGVIGGISQELSFKPCYKWNTFNTQLELMLTATFMGFKPCYKWNTFNTLEKSCQKI